MTESQQGTLQQLELIRGVHERNGVPDDWFYKGPADLLLREGRWYNDGRARKWPASLPKACFRNAALFAIMHRLPYIEGYATFVIPTHHAWCLDHDGRVIEVTWKTLGTDYFGVQLKPDWVTRGSVLFHEPNARIYKRKLKGVESR